MLSFSDYLNEMAERSPQRASKLLTYLYNRHLKVGKADRFQTQMKNVIPRTGKTPYIDHVRFELGDGEIKHVPVKSIVSGQSTVSALVTQMKIKGKWKKHDPEIPWVVHHQGTHYLVDGNHRAVEARMKGETHMLARVIDAPDDPEWHHHFNSAREKGALTKNK